MTYFYAAAFGMWQKILGKCYINAENAHELLRHDPEGLGLCPDDPTSHFEQHNWKGTTSTPPAPS